MLRGAAAAALSLGVVAMATPAFADAAGEAATPACLDAYQATQEQRLAGKIQKARESAATCAQDACPAAVKSGCMKWLRELIDSQPSIAVVARDGDRDVTDAAVYLDGELVADSLTGRAIEVDPGKHVIKLVRRGQPPIERAVVVTDGTKNRAVEFDFSAPAKKAAAPAARPPRGAPVAGIVIGGLGLGFLGTFAALSFSGSRDLDRMHDTCGRTRTCLDDDVRAVKVKLVTGDVFLAAGIASIGVGIGLTIRHFTSDPEAPRTSALRWSLSPEPGGALTSLGGVF